MSRHFRFSRRLRLSSRDNSAARRVRSGQPKLSLTQGESNASAYLVLSGSIEVFVRDVFGHEEIINLYVPGGLTGEINQLAGRPASAGGRVGPDGCEAVPFTAAQVRALIVGSAELGEIIMRAFILRRAALIEGRRGTIILGSIDDATVLRLDNFLRRNAVPHDVLDPKTNAEAALMVERFGVAQSDLPLAVCPSGEFLRRPDRQTAR